jgi:hypothetical protein
MPCSTNSSRLIASGAIGGRRTDANLEANRGDLLARIRSGRYTPQTGPDGCWASTLEYRLAQREYSAAGCTNATDFLPRMGFKQRGAARHPHALRKELTERRLRWVAGSPGRPRLGDGIHPIRGSHGNGGAPLAGILPPQRIVLKGSETQRCPSRPDGRSCALRIGCKNFALPDDLNSPRIGLSVAAR